MNPSFLANRPLISTLSRDEPLILHYDHRPIRGSTEVQRLKQAVEVSVAIVWNGRQWLVARRHPNVHLPDKWEFPGGKREPGETHEQTALRELLEECGVTAEVRKTLPAFTHDYGDRVVRITPVVCDWTAGEPEPLGCAECRWMDIEEISTLDMPAVNSHILAALARVV